MASDLWCLFFIEMPALARFQILPDKRIVGAASLVRVRP